MEQVVREELIVVEIGGEWALISLEVMTSRMRMPVFILTMRSDKSFLFTNMDFHLAKVGSVSGGRVGKGDSFGYDGCRLIEAGRDSVCVCVCVCVCVIFHEREEGEME